MFLWQVVRVPDGKLETVDAWPTLDDVIAEMAQSSWEEPSNAWASLVTDQSTGELAAVALFGPRLELLVATSDGRQLQYAMPDFYREQGLNRPDGPAG